MMSSRHIWLFGAMLLFLCGCVEEMDYYEHPSEYITFVTGVDSYETRTSDMSVGVSGRLGVEERDWPVEAGTKAAPVVSLSGDAGIIAYQYVGNWDDVKTSCSSWDMLTNAEFAFEGNMLTGEPVRWTSVPDRKDEKDNRLKVFAYAPYVELTVPGGSLIGVPSIPYEIKSDVASQEDLIEAEADVMVSSAKGMSIPLDFRHVLTAVRFKMGFAATVESVTVSGVYGSGIFTIGSGWTPNAAKQPSPDSEYEITFDDSDKSVKANEMLTDDDLTLMLMPQTLTSSAEVEVTYSDGTSDKFSLAGKTWTAGRMVTYTLYDEEQNTPIYFDLAAGDVIINASTYTGYVFEKQGEEFVPVRKTAAHSPTNTYYVYQSTEANRGGTMPPTYPEARYNDIPWSEFITNGGKPFGEAVDKDFVETVIEAWDNEEGTQGVAVNAGRTYTTNNIHVSGNLICNLTIDNIYSRFSPGPSGSRTGNNTSRTTGGIGFVPSGNGAKLIINMIGDSRLGCIHYRNGTSDSEVNKKDYSNELVFEGVGSLTVADADFYKNGGGYYSNHYNSAIGAADWPNRSGDHSWGIVINSGVVFAGTTGAENCSAIGGGGNGIGFVTINGGNVTAVATTTGTAIGGGIGFSDMGGEGYVEINGGNIYAYNFAHSSQIPSAAIGGSGSNASIGNIGNVTITGGNVYAQTALGTAIGGGSSKTREGGEADVKISGGHVVARSIASGSVSAGAGIGGGTGCSGGVQNNESINVDGGKAIINISGNAVVETGSIGGGRSGHVARGKLGTAFITVDGGYTMAQFVMAAGADDPPQFNMTGGLIRSSNTTDGADDYYNIVKNGGAVYMEDGSFIMSGGTIMDCSAEKGGAVYISKGDKAKLDPTFVMSGGTIKDCSAVDDGGAVYLENGSVTISGTAAILHNRSDSYGGAVCVRKTATSVPSFTMSGGSLSRNTSVSGGGAVYIEGGNVTVSDGTVSGNIVEEGNGGAICINSGSFVMSEGGDAEINGNVAQMSAAKVGGYGGGVYVTSTSETVEVDIFSGKIEGNSSAKRGGGIAVDMSAHPSVEAEVIVGKAGSTGVDVPDITGNVTLYEGGGLYVNGTKADVVINSGRILSNRTVGYVANPDVVNEGGMVTLNGGDVESVTVTYDGNGAGAVSTGGNSSESQKIVTDTNNRLKIPAFTRSGYRFVRWNTRPDGLGPKDYVDGETVKRSSDLTLYAIWELD